MLMAPDFSDRVTAKILLMTQPYSEESSGELKAFFLCVCFFIYELFRL